MQQHTVCGLIKFGRADYMLDLYDNGTIYMNTISYFREVEQNENRKDPHEGILSIKQGTWIKIVSDDGKHVLELSKDGSKGGILYDAKVREQDHNLRENIYSMFCITVDWIKANNRIDARNANFGDDQPLMVVILDIDAFKKRITEKLTELGYYAIGRAVRYYDDKMEHENLGIFWKPNTFAYQCEYRIFIERDSEEPLSFQIGALHDIATISRVDDLPDKEFRHEGEL